MRFLGFFMKQRCSTITTTTSSTLLHCIRRERSIIRKQQQHCWLSTCGTNRLREVREELRQYGSSEGNVQLSFSDDDCNAFVTICNPSVRNAMSGKMMAELADAIDVLELRQQQQQQQQPLNTKDKNHSICSDRSSNNGNGNGNPNPNRKNLLRCIIVRGSHGWFCAGADIGVAKEHLMTKEGGAAMNLLMCDSLHRLQSLPMISIADIEGAAIGGGAEMAVACDFRFLRNDYSTCSSHRRSYIQFVQTRMGISPGWGGGQRLVQLVGPTKALELLVTSKRCYQEEAIASSLVTEGTVTDFLQQLNRMNPLALQGAKCVVSAATPLPPPPPPTTTTTTTTTTKLVSSHQEEPEHTFFAKNTVERNVFLSLWGGPANIAAFHNNQRKKE